MPCMLSHPLPFANLHFYQESRPQATQSHQKRIAWFYFVTRFTVADHRRALGAGSVRNQPFISGLNVPFVEKLLPLLVLGQRCDFKSAWGFWSWNL